MIVFEKNKLTETDADIQKDIALKYESGESLSLEEAKFLMWKARVARTAAPHIKSKLDEYGGRVG